MIENKNFEQLELIEEPLETKQKTELEKAEEMKINTKVDFPKIKEIKYIQLQLF